MSVNVKANGTTRTIREEYQYVANQNVYTGRKWIDGKKIYTTVMVGSVKQNNYPLPSCCKGLISTVINMYAIVKKANGNWRLIPTAHKDNVRDGIAIFIIGSSGDNVYITWNSESFDESMYIWVILEYTLTNQ